MTRKYNFRLGRDPLGNMTADAVFKRLQILSLEYPNHVLSGDRLYPAQVKVWVVSFGPDASSFFSSAKILGYANSVGKYITARSKKKKMTGVDAVIALRKRGFIECDSMSFPEINDDFEDWIESMNSKAGSNYRFMIHRRDIGRMCPRIGKINKHYKKLDALHKRVLLELLEANELHLIEPA